MRITETKKLSTGITVINFTDSKSEAKYPSGCYGYIFDHLYIGDVHHALIMNWLTTDQGKTWADLMTAPQRWGWFSGNQDLITLRFTTDDATQTEGLAEDVYAAFSEYYDRPAKLENYASEEGSTTQDNYGGRARVQYQGEPDEEEAYCDYCDEAYDPDYESHSEEKCYNCGEWYCTGNEYDYYNHNEDDNHCDICGEYYSNCVSDEHGQWGHPECDKCGEYYDQNDYEEEEKHTEWPYDYDTEQHYEPGEPGHEHHHTTEYPGNERLPAVYDQATNWMMKNPNETEYTKTYLHAAQSLYNTFLQQKQVEYPEGLTPVLPQLTPEQKTVNALVNQYGMTQQTAQQIMQQLQKGQMSMFSSWQEESEGIDRGIADITDHVVFAKLAMMRLADENEEVLDIEADPASKEYRWSYDGTDLHIWQVTNRRLYGPSHYDMFGNEGYGKHSQGRVYVSPDGRVGSLYWQITHPECEDVINEWIQTNFGHPPDAVYHAYGQYQGVPVSRWDYPLVDVYSLPLKPQEKWWEQPDAKPESWYYNNNMEVPSKKKVKTRPATIQGPQSLPNAEIIPVNPTKARRKKKWQISKDKKNQKYRNNRGRSRRGAFETPGDSLVQKFIVDNGQLKVAEAANLFSGGIHHSDLYTPEAWQAALDSGAYENDGSGYYCHEPTQFNGHPLHPGDVFFFNHPTPEQVQLVKQHFGDVKRVRWPELFDEQ